MFNNQLRKEYISILKRNFSFHQFSYSFSTINNSKFKGSPKNKSNSSRLDEFTYKINEFVPSNSKYSISDKTQPDHNETSPAVRVPKYIENNDYYNKFLKSSKQDEDSTNPKTKGIIPVKFLKPGRKSKIPIKSFQKKMNKEDRLQHRKELEKREERKNISYDDRKLLKNEDTAISRNDIKYVADEKKRLKEIVSKIREEKSLERRKFFNTENLSDFDKEERLSKRLARLGVSSRRQAERMIKTGMVKIEGKEVNQNIIVNDESNIQIYSKNGFKTPIPESTRIWLFYKPVGLICTPNDEKVKEKF
jgi:ribosomal protein S4